MFERLIPSMKAIFNSRIIETSDYLIKTDNRAFCYGDGLFETIVTGSERINLIENHLFRLSRGCEVLGIEFPSSFTVDFIEEKIHELAVINEIKGDLRTKLSIWRNTGGLYAPDESSCSYFLEVKPASSPLLGSTNTAGLSEVNHTHFSPISFAKTTNALIYVLAGRERNSRDLDDIILTDAKGHLSETHIANLFWVKDQKFYTPALSTGCIEGVMRNKVISLLKDSKKSIHEVLEPKDVLASADSVFSTNASGIRQILRIDNRTYESPFPFMDSIIKQLQQP